MEPFRVLFNDHQLLCGGSVHSLHVTLIWETNFTTCLSHLNKLIWGEDLTLRAKLTYRASLGIHPCDRSPPPHLSCYNVGKGHLPVNKLVFISSPTVWRCTRRHGNRGHVDSKSFFIHFTLSDWSGEGGVRPEPGVQFFLKSSKYIDTSPLNILLMHPLPDIQPCSLFVVILCLADLLSLPTSERFARPSDGCAASC